MKNNLLIVITILSLTACSSRWTEKQKQEFAEKCAQTDTIDYLGLSFTGFSYDEIETVLVKRMHEGVLVDSFYISPDKNYYDEQRSRYWASINKTIYLKDTFNTELIFI